MKPQRIRTAKPCSPDQALAALKRLEEGLSLEEIARHYRLTTESVRRGVEKARRTMRQTRQDGLG